MGRIIDLKMRAPFQQWVESLENILRCVVDIQNQEPCTLGHGSHQWALNLGDTELSLAVDKWHGGHQQILNLKVTVRIHDD